MLNITRDAVVDYSNNISDNVISYNTPVAHYVRTRTKTQNPQSNYTPGSSRLPDNSYLSAISPNVSTAKISNFGYYHSTSSVVCNARVL